MALISQKETNRDGIGVDSEEGSTYSGAIPSDTETSGNSSSQLGCINRGSSPSSRRDQATVGQSAPMAMGAGAASRHKDRYPSKQGSKAKLARLEGRLRLAKL